MQGAIPKLLGRNKEKHETLYRNGVCFGCLISGSLEYEAKKPTATNDFKLLNVVHLSHILVFIVQILRTE